MRASWSQSIRRQTRALFLEVAGLGGDLARKADRLLRLTREAPPRHSDRAARKSRKDAALLAEWARVKDAVRARSGGRCEVVIDGERCWQDGVSYDHFWSGHGRRRPLQSVESVWYLCANHDYLRTFNKPTRAYWLSVFREHVEAHGLTSQVSLLDQAKALDEGKRR